MANPVVQQYNRGSSWAGAAAQQAPNMSSLADLGSTAMRSNASMYGADKQLEGYKVQAEANKFGNLLEWDASKFGNTLQSDANKFGNLLQWDSENRRTDANFATTLPNTALTGISNIGNTSTGQTGSLGQRGIAEHGGTIRSGLNAASGLEGDRRQMEHQKDMFDKRLDAEGNGLGGILGGTAGTIGSIASVLGQPALGKVIGSLGGLFGG